jgi:nucleoside-diphosphate-sugar epimerase
VAEAILCAAEKCESPDPINIASGREIPIRKIAELAQAIMDFRGTIQFSANSGGVSRRLLDITRARARLGFEARTDFETGFRETIEDFSKRVAEDGSNK